MVNFLVNRYIQLHPQLAQQLGRMPTDIEMAHLLGTDREEIGKIIMKLQTMTLEEMEKRFFRYD